MCGGVKNKLMNPRTQNNASNAMNFGSSTGNNNKGNNNAAVPFFDYQQTATKIIDRKMKEYITIEEVTRGYMDCKKRKGSTDDCARYSEDWVSNNIRLWSELNSMTYEVGPSRAFCVTRPKIREVFCAQFRDRVVHHIAVNHFLDLFEGEMIDDAYACRKGKGALYGAQRMAEQMERVTEGYTREAWTMACDLQGFFMSIDRRMLYDMVRKLVKEKYDGGNTDWWLWLWKKIILNAPEKNCRRTGDTFLWNYLPRNKSLFTSGGKGLPIGNLPSQVLANLLLSGFDKWMRFRLGDGGYGRYVDDFICIHTDKELLLDTARMARVWLRENLGLSMHPRKFTLQRADKGITFAGTTIKPGRLYPSRRAVDGLFDWIKEYNEMRVGKEDLCNHFDSYMGHLAHHDSYSVRWRAWTNIEDKKGLMCTNMKKLRTITKIA